MTQPLARIDLSADDIDRVVTHFYKRVRGHGMLGPIFAVHVTDWPAHEAKIAAFWKGAILREPGYDGSPMMAHRKASNVRPGMFSGWLALFDEVLTEELAPQEAARWSALAHKIGVSLRQGVVDRETLAGGVPKLR